MKLISPFQEGFWDYFTTFMYNYIGDFYCQLIFLHLIKIFWLLAMWYAYHYTRTSEHYKDKQLQHLHYALFCPGCLVYYLVERVLLCVIFVLIWRQAWGVVEPGQSVDSNWKKHFWNLILSTWPYIKIISVCFWFWSVCSAVSGKGEKWKNKL